MRNPVSTTNPFVLKTAQGPVKPSSARALPGFAAAKTGGGVVEEGHYQTNRDEGTEQRPGMVTA